jgi:hypothetical protein
MARRDDDTGDLFEHFDNPVARRSDPWTSHESEDFVDDTGLRAAQCRVVLDAVRATPGLTAKELSDKHEIDHHAVHKRLPDLRAKGLVQNREVRQCTVTGRRAMTWYAREAP